MSYSELITKIEEFAKKYCDQDPEDPKLWYHVLLVRGFAKKLAKIEGADEQVVEIAALLHDIGKYKGRQDHHIRGHELTKELLKNFDLPDKKKELILKCVFKCRSRFHTEENEIEVKVVQSADTLGALYNDNWQEHVRKTIPRDKILEFYEEVMRTIINLDSAKRIAKPKVEKLKKLLGVEEASS